MDMNLSELTEVLDESEFFERKRTVCYFVELAILLYKHTVSLRKVSRVLSGLASSVRLTRRGCREIEAQREWGSQYVEPEGQTA